MTPGGCVEASYSLMPFFVLESDGPWTDWDYCKSDHLLWNGSFDKCERLGIKGIVHPKLFTHLQFIPNLYDFRRTEKKKFGKIVHTVKASGVECSSKHPSQKYIYRIIQAYGDGMSKWW